MLSLPIKNFSTRFYLLSSDWFMSTLKIMYRLKSVIPRVVYPLYPTLSTSLNMFMAVMTRAHSFLQKILPNSVGQFAKFRCLLWQNCPNSTAYHGLPFISQISSIQFKNFIVWRAIWHSDIVRTKKITYLFCFKSAVCQVVLRLFIIVR